MYWTNGSRFSHNLSRKNIRAEIAGTLDHLGTDYVDVYYAHRWDDETPIEETLTTLYKLVREGKVNYLGASSMAAWKLRMGIATSDNRELEPFKVTQPRFNAVDRDAVADYLDVCADRDLAVCPYSPLEGGFLTGKYRRSADDIDAPESSRADLEGWKDRWDDRQWAVLDAVRSVAD